MPTEFVHSAKALINHEEPTMKIALFVTALCLALGAANANAQSRGEAGQGSFETLHLQNLPPDPTEAKQVDRGAFTFIYDCDKSPNGDHDVCWIVKVCSESHCVEEI